MSDRAPTAGSTAQAAVNHVTPLPTPRDGLLSRLALIEEARRSVDAQYYLWSADAVGYLLLSQLIDAADRGVAVRLLVDDLGFRRRSRWVAALCLHQNIEIRIFNRWRHRASVIAQSVEGLMRFARLDHRMHNKLMIGDGERVIVGGRNIADEHYGLRRSYNLVDADWLIEGGVVSELADVFEHYWHSPASAPGRSLARSIAPRPLEHVRRHVRDELGSRSSVLSGILRGREQWPDRIGQARRPVRPGGVRVVSDAPAVAEGTERTAVIDALHRRIEGARHEVLAVTPFFVPAEEDVGWYRTLIARGVRVRLLTNSLASNPGTVSNSGLDGLRAAVVAAGVELHELRADAKAKPEWETRPDGGRFLGLHAKLYIIDGEALGLGSLNLDPRSKYVNTELGVLIEDRALAEGAADLIGGLLEPANSWRVELDRRGRVRWVSEAGRRTRQPARGSVQRAADRLLGLLPIDDYI
ncbi:MAG: phospholipase D-like domain-containing protein [Miltoncostaeaceae bacterium]